jgi:hypothetical protein
LIFSDLYTLPFTTPQWNILGNVLMAESYTVPLNSPWRDKTRILGEVFPVLQSNSTLDELDIIKELIERGNVLAYEPDNTAIVFMSDNVRHQVMSYFLLNCLHTVQDYENYIRLSSVDSLLEYARPWHHYRDDDERCLYLPEGLQDLVFNKIGFTVLNHNVWGRHFSNQLETCPATR